MHQVFLVQSPCVNSHNYGSFMTQGCIVNFSLNVIYEETGLEQYTMRVFLLAFPHANGYQYLLTLCKEYM